MQRAQIITNWSVDRQPQIALDFVLVECSDITAQPQENVDPDPNLLIVEIVCSDAVLATIPAGQVLWSDPVEAGP